MGRYFRFDTNTINFVTRCDTSIKREHFTDFVFSGERDQRIYGLTKITPSITCAYDVDGLLFLKNVLGTISADNKTITVGDLPNIGSINISVDGENAGILNAKIDTWDFTIEEGQPAKAEWTAIGRNTTAVDTASYVTNFSSPVLMPSDFTLVINTNTIDFTRFNLNINNQLNPIFKTSTLPVTIRSSGLEVEGKIRLMNYSTDGVTDGSLKLVCGAVGTILLATIRVTEIPPKATGYDLPETEYSFTAFPSGTIPSIKVVLSNTLKW